MPHSAPNCAKCSEKMVSVGKLPAVWLKPPLLVFKCEPCRRIETITPGA